MNNRVLALMLCSIIVGSSTSVFAKEPTKTKAKGDDSWKQELARTGMDLGTDLIKTGSRIGEAFAIAEAQRRGREGGSTTGAVTAEDIAKLSEKLAVITRFLTELVGPALVTLDNKIDDVEKKINVLDESLDNLLKRIKVQKKALPEPRTTRALTTGSKIEEID